MIDLNGLLGRVLNAGGKVLDTPGKKLLAGGAAAGLLFTDTGRDIAGGALKYGGLAALGALAYHAWQKHREGQEGQEGQEGRESRAAEAAAAPSRLVADGHFAPAAAEAAFVPPAPVAREGLARLLIVAMVTAAKADGTLDAEEQGKILGHAEGLKLSDEEQSFLFAEFARPFDMEPVLAGARTPEVAAELYAASAIAVGQASPAEAHYLKRLAGRLKLPEGVVNEIHGALGLPPAIPAAA